MAVRTDNSRAHYARSSLVRDLYTRVVRHAGGESHNVLAVTSAIDGEGKTLVVTSLAIMLANDRALAGSDEAVNDVLILDWNQRPDSSPGATEEFGVATTPGLIQYLTNECELDDIVQRTFLNHLWVMPVGGAQHNFSVLIRTPRLLEMMESLRQRFGLILLDLPSVLTTTDTQLLAALADQLVLVVRAGVTPSKLVTQALDELDREKLVGVVLNDTRKDLPDWLDQRL